MAQRSGPRSETFWDEAARPSVSTRKRRELWMEQSEFWREPDEAHAEHLLAEASAGPAPRAEAPASRMADDLDRLQERPAAARPDTVAVYRARASGGHLAEIAKFLQVNDAVQGMRGDANLALPQGRFFARFSLWKGNPVGTPFLMGC